MATADYSAPARDAQLSASSPRRRPKPALPAACDPLAERRRVADCHIPAHLIPVPVSASAYGLRLEGDCLEPEAFDGDLAVVDPEAELKTWAFVTLWPLASGILPMMKRLIMRPGVAYAIGEGGGLVPAVVVEALNPARRFAVPLDRLKAVHAVVAVLRPGTYEREVRP